MWVGDREHVCGQGRQSERLELLDKNSHRVTVRTEVGSVIKPNPPTVENHRQGSLEKHTDRLRRGR